jgi:Cytochrome P460
LLRFAKGDSNVQAFYHVGLGRITDGAKQSSSDNDKVLGSAPMVVGLESPKSIIPGSFINVQIMVKDSKKYAATGGWGFADFKNGKPGDEALIKTCFPCHQPAKDRDYVLYALRAVIGGRRGLVDVC